MPRNGISRLLLAAALLAAAACSEDANVDPGPAYPVRGAVVSGDLQHDTVADPLPAALVVRVTDQEGRALEGQTVTWTVTAGGGTLFATTSVTDAAGEASNRWTLGTVAGDTQRVEARMIDPGSAAPVVLATFRAVGLPDAAAAIVARAPAARAGSAGQALADSLEVLVADAYGNPVPGVPVVWLVGSGGGTVSPGSTVTGPAGTARAQWTLGLTLSGQQTAEASISPAVRAAFTATAGIPLGATLVTVGGDGQAGTVGRALAQPLVVELRTGLGQPIAGAQVTWTPSAGSGSVTPPVAVTGADGRAATTWTLGTVPGPQQVTATVQGAANAGSQWTLGTVAGDTQRVESRMMNPEESQPVVLATFRAVGLPDAPATITARAPAARAGSAGEPLPDSLEVLVADAYGNPVPGAPVVWLAVSGGGTVSPGSTVTGPAGTARAQWTLGLTVGGQQVAEASISPAVRAAFTATAGIPMTATLTRVSGDGQSGTVGAALPQPLTVELRTSVGQPIAGAQVTWTPAAGSGSVTPPVSVTGADGRASATWTLGTVPGPQQATATVQGAANAVFGATAAPGPAAAVTVVPEALSMSAVGDTARLSATARDAYGNAAAAPVVWSSLEPAVATVDAAGLVTARGNGAARITATAGARADTAAVTVSQQAVRLDLTPRADTLNARGDTIVFTGRVVDRNGQPVPGVAITWTSTTPLRMITPGVFVSRNNGVATVTASGGGFQQQATVLSRQVPATLRVRSGTLIVNDTVLITPARTGQITLVQEVRDSNGVAIAVADRPAPAVSVTGVISAATGSIVAANPGTGTATVRYGEVAATAPFTVIAFDSVAADDKHGCGLTTGGDVYCWGSGFNVPQAPVGRPRKVPLPGPAAAITPQCALLRNGQVYCGLASASPAPWTGVPSFVSLAAEGCALTASGTAYCKDADGVVRPLAGYTFVQVDQRSDFQTGEILERCGLRADGQVVCWVPGGAPAPLPGGQAFRQIALGQWMSCGIATDGRLLCWGDLYGSAAPVLVSASLGLVSLDAGYANACGLRADGALFCWGAREIDDGAPSPPVPPAAKWPTLRFTDYSVGQPGFVSTTFWVPLECGAANGTLWCDGGEFRWEVTGRTGGAGLSGRVISPF